MFLNNSFNQVFFFLIRMDPLGIASEIVDVSSIKPWSEIKPRDLPDSSNFGNQEKIHCTSPFPFDTKINSKVALW